jgi:hypothetical protein
VYTRRSAGAITSTCGPHAVVATAPTVGVAGVANRSTAFAGNIIAAVAATAVIVGSQELRFERHVPQVPMTNPAILQILLQHSLSTMQLAPVDVHATQVQLEGSNL